MEARTKINIALAVFVGLVIIFFMWYAKKRSANMAQQPESGNSEQYTAGVPVMYFEGAGFAGGGYGGNMSMYMPMFGFVGYSTYATF